MQKNTFVLLIFTLTSLCSPGCAKIEHLPQLLTLKSYSEHGERADRFVQDGNESFEKLRQDTVGQKLIKETDSEVIVEAYGKPVLAKEVKKEATVLTRWLYRYPVREFDSDKVYLYFDKDRKLVHWEFVPYVPQDKKAP